VHMRLRNITYSYVCILYMHTYSCGFRAAAPEGWGGVGSGWKEMIGPSSTISMLVYPPCDRLHHMTAYHLHTAYFSCMFVGAHMLTYSLRYAAK